jgi:hypothetical protein
VAFAFTASAHWRPKGPSSFKFDLELRGFFVHPI